LNKRDLKKWREDYTVWDAPCLGDGLHLNVHFDEKDLVKRLGGRWNPDPSGKGGHWWMPKDKLTMDCPIDPDITEEFGVTILQWLNDHKMIAGQYEPNADVCREWIASQPGLVVEEYEIISQDADANMTFRVYPNNDVVQIGPAYRTMADSRTIWNDMMKVGWRKVISTNSEVSS